MIHKMNGGIKRSSWKLEINRFQGMEEGYCSCHFPVNGSKGNVVTSIDTYKNSPVFLFCYKIINPNTYV